MITLEYGQLRDVSFHRALGKLVNCSSFKSQKTTINIAKINKLCLAELKLVDEQFRKLVEAYAEKTETGEVAPLEGREGTFSVPKERQAEWEEKVKELFAITTEIDRPRVPYSEVHGICPLSPLELAAIEPLLDCDETEASS